MAVTYQILPVKLHCGDSLTIGPFPRATNRREIVHSRRPFGSLTGLPNRNGIHGAIHPILTDSFNYSVWFFHVCFRLSVCLSFRVFFSIGGGFFLPVEAVPLSRDSWDSQGGKGGGGCRGRRRGGGESFWINRVDQDTQGSI